MHPQAKKQELWSTPCFEFKQQPSIVACQAGHSLTALVSRRILGKLQGPGGAVAKLRLLFLH